MTKTRWGIIGPGSIAHNFADGLAEAPSGELIAIASRSAERRKAFGDDYGIAEGKRYETYEAICADPDVDAIYVSTPHPWHAELSIMAMRARKPVVCEKPAGLTAAEVTAMVETARQEGVFFMEAFMYRCHPQIARVLEIIKSGEIGTLKHIRVTFGFAGPKDPASRLMDPALGGGGILDVGGYPVSFARLIAGASAGTHVAEPVEFKGTGTIGATGVDETAYAVMKFANGFTADIATAVQLTMDNIAVIYGDKGRIIVHDPWVPGRNAGPSDITLTVVANGEERVEEHKHPEHLFAFEAELASRAIADGLTEAPAPACGHADSIGNNTVLDMWRHQVGYRVFTEIPETSRVLPGVLPKGLPQIPSQDLCGLSVSSLVMGCDNKNDIGAAAVVWDAYWEAGGRTFDTAFHYGKGLHETVLADWMDARGVRDQATVIVKGAHSPYCTPRTIRTELEITLERTGADKAAIYIMHRDNPDVPVGEFIDALNELKEEGLIGIFGGSNWTINRFLQANAFAAQYRFEPMRILNNNLSLAVMEKPVWAGCLSSNTPEALQFLRDSHTAHMSWSSQARGYFLPEALRNRLPLDSAPETCFGSANNAERRRRAEALARERGVETHNIATAWVIAQSFPSIALIGPRSAGELATTLPSLTVNLTEAEAAWLNLESDTR